MSAHEYTYVDTYEHCFSLKHLPKYLLNMYVRTLIAQEYLGCSSPIPWLCDHSRATYVHTDGRNVSE